MDKVWNWISVIAGVLGGIAVKIFGAFDVMLAALLIAMVLDYVSGVVKGIYQQKLSSAIGFKGILKKVVVLLVVAAANLVQGIVGDGLVIREIVITFYLANELLSLLENAAAVSTKIPQPLKDILLQLRDKGGQDNADTAKSNSGEQNLEK